MAENGRDSILDTIKHRACVNRPAILAIMLMPPVAYPLYTALLFIQDSLTGDGVILGELEDTPRRLWGQFWSGWVDALLPRYLAGLLLAVVSLTVRRVAGRHSPWLLGTLGAIIGGVAGYRLGGGVRADTVLVPAICGSTWLFSFGYVVSLHSV